MNRRRTPSAATERNSRPRQPRRRVIARSWEPPRGELAFRAALLVLAALLSILPLSLQAEETILPVAEDGRVEIPLEIYNRLLEAARNPTKIPRPAPASYALGSAQAKVQVTVSPMATAAEVHLDLAIDVLEDEWVLIPVLPAATAVDSAAVGGRPVQLLATPLGLAWGTRGAGSYRMQLIYRVDAVHAGGGFSLATPLPEASAISLDASLPGKDLDVAVIPAAGLEVSSAGGATRIRATIPTSRGVQITWRAPSGQGHALSRATYEGRLEGEAVIWTGRLEVETFSGETVRLPLLPRSVTLSELRVDGKSAAILVEGDRFTTPIKGLGRHEVTLGFETPLVRGNGPPGVKLQVPAVPVSRFDLTLPGRKEVSVTPAANVSTRLRDGTTVATVFAPMTDNLAFSWAEAVPEDVRAEVRANVSAYHAVHAEEGVLDIRAFVVFEITRGETNLLSLAVPEGVQVNAVSSPSGAVADWRMDGSEAETPRRLQVFLDRKVRGRLLLELHYDCSLGTGDDLDAIGIPLLTAPEAHRQRGMVALLSSPQLTLEPKDEGGATRVGENQLPPFVREELELTVAHTFKYVEVPPGLVVEAQVPKPRVGRFDAQVDTLLSLGEVTLTGSASIEVQIKAGSLGALALRIPEGVNVLHLTAPSLRSQKVSPGSGGQRIDVEFTQEMEGQFRLEVTYEQILADRSAELAVPLLLVPGAEVGQGRLAVEALSAAEVQSTTVEGLTDIDAAELPRQLVLRTTNPILLAYKYVQSDPHPRLGLQVTRHDVLDVQQAAIDEAVYRTLFTRDGLMVTTVRFLVRNSSKQFLRIALPREAEVWSAFVDGRSEKPALAQEAEGSERNILLKIVNSTQGFPVQLVYATPGSRIRGLGTAEAALPIPDILVTRSRWDVYLPAEMRYRRPSSNLDLVASGERIAGEEVQAALARQLEDAAARMVAPLTLSVPTAGVHFAFEKLYANQADQRAWLAIPYASRGGARIGAVVSLLATLAFWGGLYLARVGRTRRSRRLALGICFLAALVLAVTLGHFGASATPAALLTLLLGLLVAGGLWRRSRGLVP